MGNAFTLVETRPNVMKGQLATQAAAYRQDLTEAAPFAPLRQNNKVECFTTGKAYYTNLANALMQAAKSIFIAGWQVNWDLELIPGKRLIDILHDRVCSSDDFRVFVMPWMSPKVGLNTNDLDTMLAVFQLNAGRKSMQAVCCPAGAQSDYQGTEGAAFSHHQKLIVIDNKIAYIGGMDLAYGRCDDESFSLDPGKRRFNERYNPGVPPAHAITPKDGPTLSALDLMSTVLTAGAWNAGGNTEPGALSRLLHSAVHRADELAIQAVELVNQRARATLDAAKWSAKESAALLKAGVKSGEAVVIGAAQAVSRQCAAVRIPDLYGAVKAHEIGGEPTSSLPNDIRNADAGVRAGWNDGVDSVAHLHHYLEPLKRLRVDPKPGSTLPDMVSGSERAARRGVNAVIDATAAAAGTAHDAAAGAQMVCVEIAPAVEQGVASVNRAATSAAEVASSAVNAYQRAIVAEINAVREAVNDGWLELVSLRNQALSSAKQAALRRLEQTTSNLSQAKLQAIIDRFKRLLKLLYMAQIALNWTEAKAHPLLLDPKTKSAVDAVLDETQPREPWQDVHCRIEGPAVYDVAMNFIRRWSAINASYLSDQTAADAGAAAGTVIGGALGGGIGAGLGGAIGSEGGPAVPGAMNALRKLVEIPAALIPTLPKDDGKPARPTGVAVRVMRSAPQKLREQEAKAMGEPSPGQEQHEIQTQMVNLITNATDFVYIENQFFQTEFGIPSMDVFSDEARKKASGPITYLMSQAGNNLKARLSSAGDAEGKKWMPQNAIGAALGDRIAQAVRMGHPFHVYMVLPVHPEGCLNDILVVGQIHWTMQSLVFADHSLVNRVRRAIKARELCKNVFNNGAWHQALVEAGKVVGEKPLYESVAEDQWSKYLTLLNLRNCQRVGGVVRTEQIYVHSKLLIVDDRHVLLGSANINDRSQSGKRDSEIAVMLMDTAVEKKPLRDVPVNVNPLARKLRVDLWKKHLALTCGGNDVVKPAKALEALVEKPAADETIEAIQKLARINAGHYRKAFPFVPWSGAKSKDDGASLWPVCPHGADAVTAEKLAAKMPFDERFWSASAPHYVAPNGIVGFFTQLPVNWTIGEYNHPGEMSVMALTDASDVMKSIQLQQQEDADA